MSNSLFNSKVLFFCSLVALACLSACKDNENDVIGRDEPTPEETQADHTVVMIFHCGKNDAIAIEDLCEMIALREEGKIADNVNVVGYLKPSESFKLEGVTDSLFYFELKPMQGLSAEVVKQLHEVTWKSLEKEKKIETGWKDLVLNNLKTSVHGEITTDINSADSLASFIKRAAEQHPAKHYSLLLLGHGTAWNPFTDKTVEGAYEETTRSSMEDDNLVNGRPIALDELILGVKRSGVKMQTLFTHNCMMASFENITSYATQFDHLIASSEVTYGGYLDRFVQNLSQAGDDENKLQTGLKDVVDRYVECCREDSFVSSTGYYDLRKLPALLTVVKEAKDWFVDANSKDPQYMRDVILYSNYCHAGINKNVKRDREIITHPENCADEITQDLIAELIEEALGQDNRSIEYEYIFATMLKSALDNSKYSKADLDFDKMQSIYDRYLTVLQDMSYINCTDKKVEMPLYPYLYTSPSIMLVNFNENCFSFTKRNDIVEQEGFESEYDYIDHHAEILSGYIEKGDYDSFKQYFLPFCQGNYYAAEGRDVKKIAATYCSTPFHKQTGWGDLLKQTTYNPIERLNVYRLD